MPIVTRPYAAQPQRHVRIDRSNPLNSGLRFVYDAAQGVRDVITGDFAQTLDATLPAIIESSDLHRAAYITAAAADNLQWGSGASTESSPVNEILSGATQSTVEVLFRTRNTATTPHLLSQWNISSGNHWLVQINGTGLIWVAAEDSAANRRRWDGTSLFTANVWHRLILSWRGGSDYTAYLDNSPRTLSAVNTAALSIRPAAFALRIAPNTGGTPNVDVALFRVWDRGLSLDEVSKLAAASPFEFYESRRIWTPSSASSGNSYTFSVNGVLTPTGTLVRQTGKLSTGVVPLFGNPIKQTNATRTGSTSTTGGVNKLTNKRYSGSSTTVGNLTPSTGLDQSVNGSITTSGVLTTAATFTRFYDSSITTTGSIVRSVAKRVGGTLSLTGSAFKRMFVALASSIAAFGVATGFKFTPVASGVFQRGMRFIRRFIGRR